MKNKEEESSNSSSPRRILNKILSGIAKREIVPSKLRTHLHKWRGVNFAQRSSTFIGDNVSIDSISPTYLSIGERCIITSGTKIVTHFIDTEDLSENPDFYFRFYDGKVVIEDDVFLGFNVVIAAPVTIGKGSIIGANSVVMHDIPPGCVAAGTPAKVIKEIGKKKS